MIYIFCQKQKRRNMSCVSTEEHNYLNFAEAERARQAKTRSAKLDRERHEERRDKPFDH
jgi:hypothetical protein